MPYSALGLFIITMFEGPWPAWVVSFCQLARMAELPATDICPGPSTPRKLAQSFLDWRAWAGALVLGLHC